MPQAAVAPIIMGVMSAASIGASALQAKSAQKAQKKATEQSQQFWQQNAFPAPAAVNAAATENRGALGQARLGSYQNLASNLASRGFGSGSGLMAERAGEIESGYLQALGKQGTQMTQFANTPMFGPPSSAYSTPVSGGVSAGLGKGSDLMDTALGFYMMKNLIGGGKTGQTGQTGAVDPYEGVAGMNPYGDMF